MQDDDQFGISLAIYTKSQKFRLSFCERNILPRDLEKAAGEVK